MLRDISELVGLAEGSEGIRSILREVFRKGKTSTKELAYAVGIPIPVVAAARRELEKKGFLARNGGAFLSAAGERFVTENLGLTQREKFSCSTCLGKQISIPDSFKPVLKKLENLLSLRPKPKSWLDQAYGTPKTALLRALFMLEKGDIEGRRIIFLGDDDFTSIAAGLLGAAYEIVTVDVDSRLLDVINHISRKENIAINCVEHDLREPLPKNLRGRFDTVFTDPPYTISGLNLFLSRGITALNQEKTSNVYFAFSHQPPKRMLAVQRVLAEMGLAITEQIPRFNTYKGAEMFANTTYIAHAQTTEKTRPLIKGTFFEKIYTGEITQTERIYNCKCGTRVTVGTTQEIRTIEQLKEAGCPTCGRKIGFKLLKKLRLKEVSITKVKLRNFRYEDFSEILEFEREISRRSFPKTPILEKEYHWKKLKSAMRRAPGGLKVAFVDKEIVGWLWLRTEKDRNTDEEFGYVKTIFIKPEYRHQGFGRKLMEAGKQYFAQKGIRRVDLIVSATNHGAESFFSEMGFGREHSTMRIYLNEGRELD